MKSLIDILLSADFWFSVIQLTTPLLFATMAALISDKAGVLNIGIEGTMLFAALMGVFGGAFSHNVWVGVLCAVAAGVLFSLIFCFFYLEMETDIVLTGIALNLLSSAITIFLLYVVTGDKGVSSSLNSGTIPNVDIPIIKNIPFIGRIISGQSALTYLGVIILILLALFLKYTRLGLHIQATGQNSDSVETAGISTKRIRFIALLISGVMSGLGGAFMSMSYVSMFTKDMVAGRGFIALAAEAMGHGAPMASAFSAFVFGFADAFCNRLQLFDLPSDLVRTLPYIFTIIALALHSAGKIGKGS